MATALGEALRIVLEPSLCASLVDLSYLSRRDGDLNDSTTTATLNVRKTHINTRNSYHFTCSLSFSLLA